MIIAIDGTAGSGKSTTAKKLAEQLDFFHIDSGSLYRIATYFCIANKIDSNDDNLEVMLENMNIELVNKNFLLNGEDVSLEIREHYISDSVSDYSSNVPGAYLFNLKLTDMGCNIFGVDPFVPQRLCCSPDYHKNQKTKKPPGLTGGFFFGIYIYIRLTETPFS